MLLRKARIISDYKTYVEFEPTSVEQVIDKMVEFENEKPTQNKSEDLTK